MSIKGSARKGVSILAIATLVVGLIPWYGALAVFIGFPALHRMKVTGERGRIVAIIGLTFGILWAIDVVLYRIPGSH